MKKIILFAAIVHFVSANAQTINGDYLDINNMNSWISADGGLFAPSNTSTFTSGEMSPATNGLWIGGVDAGNSLKVAAMTYRQTGTDFWPGPVMNTSSYTVTCYKLVQ